MVSSCLNWSLLLNILRSKEVQILALSQLINYFIGKISWKKYSKNVHQKRIPGYYLIFANSKKHDQCIQETLWNKLLKENYKKSGQFQRPFMFFNPVSCNRNYYGKQNGSGNRCQSLFGFPNIFRGFFSLVAIT